MNMLGGFMNNYEKDFPIPIDLTDLNSIKFGLSKDNSIK